MQTKFSIIIIHFNGYKRLFKLLESISKLTLREFEVIIIDNASRDNSFNEIQNCSFEFDINFISNDINKGYASAVNQGISLSNGKYVLICNNDIILPINILSDFYQDFIADSQIGMVVGNLVDFSRNPINTISSPVNLLSQFDGINKLYRYKLGVINQPKFVKNVRGACISVRRKTIEQSGGMDEDFFFYFEDTEWCHRVLKNGWKILYDPRVIILHENSGSSKNYFEETRIEFMRSRFIFWQKVFSPRSRFFLHIWNLGKIFADFFFYMILSILTLFLNKRFNKKLRERHIIIRWILSGQPKKSGLPR